MSLISILKRKNNKILFTTPSHGGKFCILHKFYQWYRSDISEVDAYNPEDALKKAEKVASNIYGTKYTKFLTNGSTSGIITAVIASQAKKILIWDKAHPCHKNACKLANVNYTEYSLPLDKELGLYRAIRAEKVIELIQKNKPEAIIITSPTYEGFVANVKENLDINVFDTIIPRNVRLAEAPSYGMPVIEYDNRSTGAASYRYLAEEIVRHHEG